MNKSVAFIIHIFVDDLSLPSLEQDANEIHDALERSGFDVDTVAPWQRPSELQANGLTEQLPPTHSGLNVSGPFNPFGQ